MRERDESAERGSWLRSRATIVLVVFLGIAAFFLVTEHTAHLFGVLPYALLLLCPILHLFMHGSHGSARGDTADHRAHRHPEDQR
jgi:hypothetical protein